MFCYSSLWRLMSGLPSPSSPHLTTSVGRAFPWVLTKALPHALPACSLTVACKTHLTSAQGTTCWKGKRLQNQPTCSASKCTHSPQMSLLPDGCGYHESSLYALAGPLWKIKRKELKALHTELSSVPWDWPLARSKAGMGCPPCLIQSTISLSSLNPANSRFPSHTNPVMPDSQVGRITGLASLPVLGP